MSWHEKQRAKIDARIKEEDRERHNNGYKQTWVSRNTLYCRIHDRRTWTKAERLWCVCSVCGKGFEGHKCRDTDLGRGFSERDRRTMAADSMTEGYRLHWGLWLLTMDDHDDG